LTRIFRLKSDTQQPTPDKDKGDRDINVSEAISEGPSSVASASVISTHEPPYIDQFVTVIYRQIYICWKLMISCVNHKKVMPEQFLCGHCS
jgi:hypothetical protein